MSSRNQTVIGAIYDVVPGFAVESIGGRDMLRCGGSEGSIAVDVGKLAAHILAKLGQPVGAGLYQAEGAKHEM